MDEQNLKKPVPETAETSNEKTPETVSEEERIVADIETLRALFPELTPEQIPEEVWKKVSEGESLAASYALFYLKEQKEKERIEIHNRENEEKALGKIRQDKDSEEYYSPETVRKMSQKEVRKNYDAILRSMDRWN
ncbi:MAG: hypothetical protein J6J21_03315 [Clostridia bacterium]|nr:hypothetical protein [Clostridia bacterium]MBQ2731046.1 hypothetical protein [Clostridia bacterium]